MLRSTLRQVRRVEWIRATSHGMTTGLDDNFERLAAATGLGSGASTFLIQIARDQSHPNRSNLMR